MTTPARMAFVVLCLCVVSSCSETDSAPDVVLVGGPILSPGAAWMPGVVTPPVTPDAIAIRGGRVSAVGSADEVRRLAGPSTRIIELDGRSVLPGLTDNHLHSIGGGPGVDLSAARTLEDVADALVQRAAEVEAGELIVTNSDWHEGQLAEQRLPYRDDL
ncbi:MAG: amidohydrolase family protein, partial [Longimicrobiales bacterium]